MNLTRTASWDCILHTRICTSFYTSLTNEGNCVHNTNTFCKLRKNLQTSPHCCLRGRCAQWLRSTGGSEWQMCSAWAALSSSAGILWGRETNIHWGTEGLNALVVFHLALIEMWQPEGKLTCHREVVEWREAVVAGHLRLLFVTDEGAIAL